MMATSSVLRRRYSALKVGKWFPNCLVNENFHLYCYFIAFEVVEFITFIMGSTLSIA